MRRLLPRSALIFIMACTVVACGFQLRGVGAATVLPESWKSMTLITGNPNGELSREVAERLELNGVVLADRTDANYQLLLGPERFEQRDLSLSSEARAAEFELTMSTEFEVRNSDGTIALESDTASVFKQMENDPRNVVGKAEEVRLLQAEMRIELAQQIIRRIGFYAASLETEPLTAE